MRGSDGDCGAYEALLVPIDPLDNGTELVSYGLISSKSVRDSHCLPIEPSFVRQCPLKRKLGEVNASQKSFQSREVFLKRRPFCR